MTASVIHMRKPAIIRPPHAETSVSAPPAADAPMFQSSLPETLAIKRFLGFALADIKYQLEQMARNPAMARKHFKENKAAALLISEYIIGLVKDIDENLATMSAPTAETSSDPSPQGAA